MKIRLVMDNKLYLFLVRVLSSITDYLSGMFTEPKYIVLRTVFTMIVPDISVVFFMLFSHF
ncbi:MAG: hypothetical protein GF368_02180 [Candidatus Aenigmarchaeota archaeon]|nr:hypothetical protein [Candidatus Aenigmarchaeota archaeon]